MKDRLIQKRHRLRLELDYWQGKYRRFTMDEVPEGFARRQGAGIGLIGKYAGMYLRSLFHEAGESRKANVRVVKGAMTAGFRKLRGVQDEWERKSRDNHTHHCIDAIVIACIGLEEHNVASRYYRDREAYERQRGVRPMFPKPWPTFADDMKRVAEETIVVHDTRDNLAKREYKRQYHVKNDGNYLLAIYEGMVGKRVRRDYRLVRAIGAAARMKASASAREPLVAATSDKGLPLRHVLRIGQHVLLYESSPVEIRLSDAKDINKRLYVVTGLSHLPAGTTCGTIVTRHHQEARMAKDVKISKGAFKSDGPYRGSIFLCHTQFHALVEGEDFSLNVLGEITMKNPLC